VITARLFCKILSWSEEKAEQAGFFMIITQALAEQFKQDFENDIELEYLIQSHLALKNHKEEQIDLFEALKEAGAGYFAAPTLFAKARLIKYKANDSIYNLRKSIKDNVEYDTWRYYKTRDRIYEITALQIGIDTLRTPENLNKILKRELVELADEQDADISLTHKNFIDLNSQGIRNLSKSLEFDYQNSDPELPIYVPTPRKLRKIQRKLKASLEMRLGLIGGRFGVERATKNCVAGRIEMNLNNQHFLDTHEVKFEDKSFRLADIALTREKRLAEMQCLLKGIELQAEAQGLRWASVVASLPPHLHVNPTAGANSWDGTLPDQSIRYIHDRWKKMRAYCAKKKITLAGFWTVETHLDGTPHVNFLVYFDGDRADFVESAFNIYFSHGKRAIKFRLDGDVVDGQKIAKFSSYASKYFTKTFNVEALLTSVEADTALKEESLASAFGYRRYGFFGIPSLQLWRKLRASKETPDDKATEAIWRAARGGRASDFIALSGGLGIKAKARTFKTVSVAHKKSRVTVGVRNVKNGYELIVKRVGEWTIKKIIEAVEEVKKTVTNDAVTLKPSYPRSALSLCADELTHAFSSVTSTPPPQILTS
jgi:hypothetical protein